MDLEIAKPIQRMQGTPGRIDSAEPDLPSLDPREICKLPNICDQLSDEFLNSLGKECYDGYIVDLNSRSQWDDRMATAQKLAMQVAENKTFPWPNASNIKFPLVTIAALQYHARAYPTLVVPDNLVRYKVYGNENRTEREQLAKLLCQHMNYQLTEEDTEWEDNMDLALIVQPIMGCVFKKTFFDPAVSHNRSIAVLPNDLVVHYYTPSLERSERVSHRMKVSHNDYHFGVTKEFYRKVDLSSPVQQPANRTKLDDVKDKQQGTTAPIADPLTPHTFIEQACNIDLDSDGYREPYTVTFDEQSQQVVRIVARYTEGAIQWADQENTKIARIQAENHFTKYGFIPAPDGGFYDLGFGALLSPLSHSIDSLINQLVDAGTLANTAGGFLGRGVKIKGGQTLVQPFGWKPVDSTGEDLAKNFFPLPVRQPSEVLFKLLGFLVNYGERICGAVDQNVGITPDQNTPAETARAASESGLMILSAIFKRTWRSERREFQILYSLNRAYLDQMPTNPFGVTQEMYSLDPTGVRPAADPAIMSDTTKAQQSKAALEMSANPAYGIDPWTAARRFLEALKITDVDTLQPPKGSPNAPQPAPNPKMVEAETKRMKVISDAQAKMMSAKEKLAKLVDDMNVNRAKINLMDAQALKALSEAQGVEEGHAIAALDALIGAHKDGHDVMLSTANLLLDVMKEMKGGTTDQGTVSPLAQGAGDSQISGAGPAGAAATNGVMGGSGVQ